MTRFWIMLSRRMHPLLAAGVLLQVGGCTIDFNNIAAGLVTSIVNTFVTDFIFSLLNVAAF